LIPSILSFLVPYIVLYLAMAKRSEQPRTRSRVTVDLTSDTVSDPLVTGTDFSLDVEHGSIDTVWTTWTVHRLPVVQGSLTVTGWTEGSEEASCRVNVDVFDTDVDLQVSVKGAVETVPVVYGRYFESRLHSPSCRLYHLPDLKLVELKRRWELTKTSNTAVGDKGFYVRNEGFVDSRKKHRFVVVQKTNYTVNDCTFYMGIYFECRCILNVLDGVD